MSDKRQDVQFTIIDQEIPSGETLGFPYSGNKFYIIDSTAELLVKTEFTVALPYKQGQGQSFEKDFQRIEFNNPGLSTISFRCFVGFGEYRDQRFALLESQTQLVGSGETSLSSSTEITFNGVPSGSQIQRKEIIISNLDTTSSLDILDKNDNAFAVVPFGQIVALQTSDSIKVRNNTGSAITYRVGEIFYVF